MTRIVSVLVVAALTLAGCGDDRDAVRSADDLAAALLTADDLGSGWSVAGPPGAMSDAEAELAETGVVTDAAAPLLPRFELCDAAEPEARAAAAQLDGQAFRAFELAVDDPIEPPDDREGHMVFLQEFLLTEDADDLTADFALLADGLRACLGPIDAGEEGPGEASVLPVPELGDERFGVLVLVEEAGGWAEWRVHQIVVRDGSVLALVNLGEIVAGVEPMLGPEDVDDIARTAIDLL